MSLKKDEVLFVLFLCISSRKCGHYSLYFVNAPTRLNCLLPLSYDENALATQRYTHEE